MVEIARDPAASLELRGRMFADLAQYVFPRRKAVEHSGADGEPLQSAALTVRFVSTAGAQTSAITGIENGS